MMDLTDVRELYREREKYIGKEVTVGGWIRSIRDSKTFGFIVVNDGTFFEPLQIVYSDKLENFEQISKLNVGSAIVARGTIVATPEAKQPFEMQAEEVFVEGASTADYPLQKKRHSFEYLRTISSAHEYFSGGVPGAVVNRLCDSYIFYGEGICLCAYAFDYGQRLRRSWRNVPGNDAGSWQHAKDGRRKH